MELKARRKIVNKRNNSGMVSIPPFFLQNMDAIDCEEVLMTVSDKNHILIEVVRPGREKQ